MQTLKQGSSGADVKKWQQIIGVTADGQFGPATAAATKTWQKNHGLTADGIVGAKTWAAATVEQAATSTASTPLTTSVTGTYPVLKKGSTGNYVKMWQQIIGVPTDGQFGAKTDAATRTWQQAHGISPDGIVGPVSWSTAKAVQTVSAAVPSVAQAIPAVTQAVQEAYANPSSILVPTVAPITSTIAPISTPTVVQSVQPVVQPKPTIQDIIPPPGQTQPSIIDSIVSAVTPKPKPVASIVQPEYEEESFVQSKPQTQSYPSGSANLQVPGLGNVSLQTTSQSDLAEKEKRNKMYLYGGIGAGTILLGTIIYMATKKPSRTSARR